MGVLLPLVSFFLSGIVLMPEWKGACKWEWFACFHQGKLALTPLVAWACASFYSVQIYHYKTQYRTWAVLGLYVGAVVSGFCLVHGIIVGANHEVKWLFLIPVYTFVWYFTLALHAGRRSPQSFLAYLYTLLGSLPFWAAGVFVSIQKYKSLPNTPPDCFIVTAATHGHAGLVGPFTNAVHRNEIRQVNRQLLTFWRLENIWQLHAPRSHRLFRKIYNRIGPLIARRIRSPWLADMVYLMLKPAEWMAAILAGMCRMDGG